MVGRGKGERGKGRVVRVVVEEAGVLIWPIILD